MDEIRKKNAGRNKEENGREWIKWKKKVGVEDNKVVKTKKNKSFL